MSGWKLSVMARADLLEMFQYGLDAFGERQAEKYRTSVERTFDVLATFPKMARERTEFRPILRVHHHMRHYIAYTNSGDHILIVRVVPDDVDLDQLFGII